MTRGLGIYRTAVGRKAVMAASGLVLFGFVVGHLAGNLHLYQGRDKLNAYAEFLRTVGEPLLARGELLWIARAVLLAAVVLHIEAAWAVTMQNRRARPHAYARREFVESTYSARTMRWGGVILLLFVLYHLAHLTFGWAHPDFHEGDVYRNVVEGFRVWWVSGFYVLAQLALGFHLEHGFWSFFQSLGLSGPRIDPWRRPLAAVFAWAITLGNISFPIAVLSGVVK